MLMSDFCMVLVTAGSADEAQTIGYALVDERLAACVNILLATRSIFRWEGEVHKEHEVLMIIKTRRGLFQRLSQRVTELHSYDVPEIIALPLEASSPAYLSWLTEQLPDEVPE
jgi:periplasmic divalent cation tolerance protein